MIEDPAALAEMELFQGLGPEDLTRLSELLGRKSFPAGALLMTTEQIGEAVYVIAGGSVKIFLSREDGGEIILAILGPGQTVGEMSLLDSAGRSANVATMEPSTLLWMDRASFRQCLKSMPGLSYNLIQLLTARLRLANEQILALTTLDVAGRVARQILAFADQYGRPAPDGAVRIPFRLTQRDVAALVGTSRERVNKVMVRFRELGYLSVDEGRHLAVHDRKALADRCR